MLRRPASVCRWLFGLTFACLPMLASAGSDRVRGGTHDIAPQVDLFAVGQWEGPRSVAPGLQDYVEHGSKGRRPLPTPCRAPGILPLPELHGPIGPTLLEQAVEHSQGFAFWEALTLLEALLDHFAPKVAISQKARQIQLCGAVCGPPEGSGLREVFVLAGVHWQTFALPTSHDPVGPHYTGPVILGGLRMPFSFEELQHLLNVPCSIASPGEALRRLTGPAAVQLYGNGVATPNFLGPVLHCFTDGSFTPPTGTRPAKIGWACIFVDPVRLSFGVISGGRPSWLPETAEPPSAFVGECLALVAAMRVCGTALRHRPVAVCVDCTAALGIASGQVAGQSHGIAGILRSISSFARAAASHAPVFQHIRGHQGSLFNEIADVVAKRAADGIYHGGWTDFPYTPPLWWDNGGRAFDWAGLILQCIKGHPGMPQVGRALTPPTESAGLSRLQCIEPFMPFCSQPQQVGEAAGTLQLILATYNVLSLSGSAFADNCQAGLAFAPARPAILASTFHSSGVTVAGIQEARTEAGRLNTDGFTRFCSGADKGQFGVELWFKTGHTVVSGYGHQSASVSFLPNAFTVLHTDPRRIFVLFSSASIRILFASLHAPHRGAEAHILASWWAETKRLLEKFASKGVAYLLGDFNAAVGSLTSRSVGDLSADTQDEPGDQLHDTLHRFSLWLPSTFQGVHFGPSGTYVQKRNQAESRNDYVAIPDHLDQCSIRSWVEPSIHAGQPVIDHIAALVSIRARIAAFFGSAPRRRAKVDASFLSTPAGREQAAQILESMPNVPWNVGPDEHAAFVTSHIQRGFEGPASGRPSRPRHPYLSSETWSLQKRVASLRRQLTRLRCAVRFHEMAAAFASLRAGYGGPLHQMWRSGWTHRAILSLGCLGQSLSSTSKALRTGCKVDRAAYLSGLADSVDSGGHQAHEDLRRLLCRRKKRPFTPEVLPQLLDEQGDLCEDGKATIARWRRHFSQLEGGVAMTPNAIATLDPPLAPDFSEIPFEDFPAPSDLLCAILHAKAGKACGPDGIPAELGRSQPAALQQILLPLLLKTGLLCREPLGFKSGILTWLHKGRGSKVDCGSYRAIMLLSVVAKTFHRAFRPAIYRFFEQHSTPIQLGGKKNATVLFGSHISRAYGKWCAANSVSTAILYADVSAAYYSAVRALTARRDGADRHASSCHPNPEVQQQLEKPSALSQGGATEWLQALTHDLNDRTWMTLNTDDTPVLTTQGSRPGSSWADLFFGVTVPGILAVRDQMRGEAPKIAQTVVVAWDGWKGFFEPPPSVSPTSAQVTLDDVVWADDLASYLGIPCPEDAASLVGLEASLLNDSFRSYGYSLSFGVSKTAAIVQLRGPGARAARRKLFSMQNGLPILSESGPAERLPLVPVYKHLGVRVTANNSLLPEIKQRVAAAWVSFRQGKTKVFRSKRLSLERKGAILASHVLSKLTFGCGAWGSPHRRFVPSSNKLTP